MNETMNYPKIQQRYTLHNWIRYVLYSRDAGHENSPGEMKTTGRSLRQGSFLSKFWHKGLSLSPACFYFAPPNPPFSRSTSKSLLKSCRGAGSSQPVTITGQEQLLFWHTKTRKATADDTQLADSWRMQRASRLNSFLRKKLPTSKKTTINHVTRRIFSFSIAGNFEL